MSCENCEEGAYVIDKLAKLLAEIAVIVNGPEPHDTLWSYHDLPEKVRALKQAPPAAVPAVPEVLVRAYFHRFSEVEDDYTIYHTLDGVCEQCIPVLIVRAAANKENGND